MVTSLPWSVKGVDPSTRDAAKAAARRAGMTLGEWLDHKIRDEAAEDQPAQPEQLDIAALSERLAKLSQTQMDTSTSTAPRSPQPVLSRHEIDGVISQAAAAERLTRESTAKTAGALDSIARWIEKTESRMSAGERAAAERQERATHVIADAIKSMGERLVDVERKTLEAQRRPAEAPPAPRLAFSRDGLAAAVSDIRDRQRSLDEDRAAPATRRPAMPEARIAALREDLRALSSRIDPGRPETQPTTFEQRPAANPIESMIADLGSRLDKLDQRQHLDQRQGFEPILKPLARIESEVARLSQDRSGDSYQRFELEIAHLAAKVDALAARGGDRSLLTPVLRDVAELREMMAKSAGDSRLDDLSRQISALSSEVGRMRQTQPDGGELRGLSHAIEDVRDALLSDRSSVDRFADTGPMLSLSRQIESLAGKIDTLPAMRPEVITAQAEQLAQRLGDLEAAGSGPSNALSQRIEALVIKLEDLADRPQNQLENRIELLQQRIETLAEQGPTAVMRQIEALAGRIDHLAASSNLTQLIHEGKGVKVARVDMQPVEDMLRRLAEKIDEAGKPDAESDAFDSLEQQISGLATRLDAAAATRTAETGIERTLQDLVVHLKSLREETTQAATNAARAAVSGLAGQGAPGAGIAELSTLVTGLRETHVSAGRETQDAIGAVHQTLETVISRLASLEAELASGAPVRKPMPPLTAAMPVAYPLDLPATMSVAAEDRFVAERPDDRRTDPVLAALDIPLEPGSGRPRLDGVLPSARDPQSVRQNLIAAARRSAKAATEAATAVTPTSTPEPAAKSGGSRLKQIMEKRKRPLLLGLAALILAMGTAHVVTGALRQDKPAPVDTGAVLNLVPPASAPAQTSEATVAPVPAKEQASAQIAPPNPIGASIVGPAMAMASATSTAPTMPSAAPPPAAAQTEPVQIVTGVGDLPATLGSAGLRKAAFAGDARAVYEIASRAADGPAATRDPKLALRLFERAAVAGLAPAQFRLGNMFEKGIGTTRDVALARVWYMRAAERGNAKAMHNLAVLHAEGISGKPDYATATDWFRRAAELGIRDSQYNLAILLGRGLGAPTDLGQSYLWFAIAAVQGDEDAGRKREEVALRLKPDDLAAAKRAVENWRPQPLEPLANEVGAPAKGWDSSPSAAAKAVKPARS